MPVGEKAAQVFSKGLENSVKDLIKGLDEIRKKGIQTELKTSETINKFMESLQKDGFTHKHGIDLETIDAIGKAVKLLKDPALLTGTLVGSYYVCSSIWGAFAAHVEKQDESRRIDILNHLLRGGCPTTQEEFRAALGAIHNEEFIKMKNAAFEKFQICVERRL